MHESNIKNKQNQSQVKIAKVDQIKGKLKNNNCMNANLVNK